MDVIKLTSSLEFEMIYADGTRRHVSEGVLHEANGNEIIYHQGTSRPEVIIAAAEDSLKTLMHMGSGLALLSIKMHFTPEGKAVLRELVWFADDLLNNSSAEKQGIFRLGQMDMQKSVVDMLQDAAADTKGVVKGTLESAVGMVMQMEVAHGENS